MRTVTEEVQEDVPASFVLTSFDSSGKLIQETTPLNAADPLTYEAEKLFGIDLNNDNVLGRNVKGFDREAFTDANDIETFDGASENKTLLTDQNSGEILFSDLSDPDLQKLLTYSDGSSFVPTSTQTAIDIETSLTVFSYWGENLLGYSCCSASFISYLSTDFFNDDIDGITSFSIGEKFDGAIVRLFYINGSLSGGRNKTGIIGVS